MSFDMLKNRVRRATEGLNPFRAGQCLSTTAEITTLRAKMGLNPFRAGQCLSTTTVAGLSVLESSQSLSSRAMSFDIVTIKKLREHH